MKKLKILISTLLVSVFLTSTFVTPVLAACENQGGSVGVYTTVNNWAFCSAGCGFLWLWRQDCFDIVETFTCFSGQTQTVVHSRVNANTYCC